MEGEIRGESTTCNVAKCYALQCYALQCSALQCSAVWCSIAAVELPFHLHTAHPPHQDTPHHTTPHHTQHIKQSTSINTNTQHTSPLTHLHHIHPLQQCLRERDALSDKLKMTDNGHLDRVTHSDLEDTGSRRGDTGYTGDLTVEQAYEDLKAEYKVQANNKSLHYCWLL